MDSRWIEVIRSFARWQMPVGRGARVARGGMRARVLERGACGPLADRCAAAAARRELAGHLLVAAPVWRLSLIHI